MTGWWQLTQPTVSFHTTGDYIMEIKGQIAVVTGAGSGIGEAVAIEYLAVG